MSADPAAQRSAQRAAPENAPEATQVAGPGTDGIGCPVPGPSPLCAIVLHQPEIPNNTGAIGRSCVTCGAGLHLIRPLGFDTSEKACRRAGLDYWPRLAPREHDSWTGYLDAVPGARLWILTARAERPLHEADLAWGDHFVFGSESSGLPPAVVGSVPAGQRLVIPMLPGERSMNLANAVAVVLHEHVRKMIGCGFLGLDRGRIVNNLSPGARVGESTACRAYPSA